MSKRVTRPSPLCTKRFSYSFLYFAIFLRCVAPAPFSACPAPLRDIALVSAILRSTYLLSLSLIMTCGVWQPQDKTSRGCILDNFRGICYADASKINDVIFALGSSHDTSTHRAFCLIALIIVFNFRPKPPITPKNLFPHLPYTTLTLRRRLTMSDTQGSAAVAVPPAQLAILRSDYANCTAQQNEPIPSKSIGREGH